MVWTNESLRLLQLYRFLLQRCKSSKSQLMSWNLNLQGVAQDQITSVLFFVNCLHAMATPTAMLCATSSLPIAVRVSWIHMARFQVNHTQFSRSLENWTRVPKISLSWVHLYYYKRGVWQSIFISPTATMKIRTLSALCLLLWVSSTLKSIACWHLCFVPSLRMFPILSSS